MDRTLIESLKEALQAGPEQLFAIVQETEGEVLLAALRNPSLDEAHLLALLRRRDLPEKIIDKVAELPQLTESYRLKKALAQNPSASATVLRKTLPRLHLFDLLAVARSAGSGPDQRSAAELQILRRLPESTLGHRISLARQGTAAVLAELLKEGNPAVTEACLANPRLREISLVQMIRSSRAEEAALQQVIQSPRWSGRPAVQRALLENRRTPAHFFVKQLPRLSTRQLQKLEQRHSQPLVLNLIRAEKRNRGLHR